MPLPRRGRFCLGLLSVSAVFLIPSLAVADGGALRLSEQKDGYRIAAFTTPTPLRAGPVDISVLVQDAATGEPNAEVEVSVKVQSYDNRCASLSQCTRPRRQPISCIMRPRSTCPKPDGTRWKYQSSEPWERRKFVST